MILSRSIAIAALILLYGVFFSAQEQRTLTSDATLDLALPGNFYRIAAGYTQQLAAEILFIQSSVFLGGVRPGTPPTSYGDALGHNLDVMTSLYPSFIAPYYLCQGFLPPISPAAAEKANTILETGIKAYPEDLVLRFFHGANFFLAMNKPLQGAQAFSEAATLPHAPPLFSRLAALLSAQGGDIAAGLLSLKAMEAAEEDETVKARYQQEITVFEQALRVSHALQAYTSAYGTHPQRLEQLVPEFLPTIPEIREHFIMVYDPPTLRLQRPERTTKNAANSTDS
ncbi:MAG: hypothetical protein BWK76_26685 [Desulfobulbaceae bacterium A2]|nr:MAG: hypothetical protein BWK76_26685 [Desulfobulbaceae bacterium A2]